jgi:hypothetical protein
MIAATLGIKEKQCPKKKSRGFTRCVPIKKKI